MSWQYHGLYYLESRLRNAEYRLSQASEDDLDTIVDLLNEIEHLQEMIDEYETEG